MINDIIEQQQPIDIKRKKKKKKIKKYISDADPIEICPITGNIILRFFL